jgi:hypothetical protein
MVVLCAIGFGLLLEAYGLLDEALRAEGISSHSCLSA